MDWGIFLGVIGVLAIPLALATLGLTMVATTRGEFNFVRGCFVAAALVSTVTVFLLYWYYREGSLPMRVVVAAVAGAVIFGGLAAALNWVDRKQAPLPPPTGRAAAKMSHTPQELERRRILITQLRDQYYADHPSPIPTGEQVTAWINSKLIESGEGFRAFVPKKGEEAGALVPEETMPLPKEEVSRRKVLVDSLIDELKANHAALENDPDGAVAWLNAQLVARGEVFTLQKGPPPRPSGVSNLTVITNSPFKTTFMKSDGAVISNENLNIIGFDDVFVTEGGSLTNKNVTAIARGAKPPDDKKKK
jgi:hypothetical protein